MDEMKKIAVIKEVNLTNVREQIKNLELLIKLKDSKEKKETEEEKRLKIELVKGKAYLKEVETAKEVCGEANKIMVE